MILNLIDSGVGSLRAVEHLIARCGLDSKIIKTPDDLVQNQICVLPGVGNISEMSKGLIKNGLFDELTKSDCKIIGICVGFQILFESSEEDLNAKCLSRVNGKIKNIKKLGVKRTPRMGWDYICNSELKRVGKFYFAHSFGADKRNLELEKPFFSSISPNILSAFFNKDICGLQFHPEKSHKQGEIFFKMAIDHLKNA